jgi:peroxiredoxin
MKNPAVLLFLLMVIGCSVKEPKEQTTAGAVEEIDLPAMTITTTSAEEINVKTLKGRTVLILFQPDCDHCQREAEAIRKNLEAFQQYQLLFISSSPINEITAFAETYKLNNHPQITFGYTTLENVLNNFGPIPAPSVYVYNENGKLVKSFNGETDIDRILNVL